MEVLEAHMGAKRTRYSFVERWTQCPPSSRSQRESHRKRISPGFVFSYSSPSKDLLGQSGFYPFFYDGYHDYDRFSEDYQKEKVWQATIRDSVHAVPTVCGICLALQSRVIKGDTPIAERLREPNSQRRAPSRSCRIPSLSRLRSPAQFQKLAQTAIPTTPNVNARAKVWGQSQ